MPIAGAIAVPHPPLIIPQVGRGEEGGIQATINAYHTAAAFLAQQKPDTLVLISPHAAFYADWFHLSPGAGAAGDFGRFGAPGVKIAVDYDQPLVAAIEQQAAALGLPAGTKGEKDPELDHASLIPLYFINKYYQKYKVVRMGLSALPAEKQYRMGQAITAASQALGRRVMLVASGDLSHKLLAEGPYGFAPEGPELDRQITRALAAADFASLLSIDENLADKGAECGLRSFQIMAGALDNLAVQARLLSYEGPFGVGYAVATFLPGAAGEAPLARPAKEKNRGGEPAAEGAAETGAQPQLEADEAAAAGTDPCVALARYSLEHYVQKGRPATLPQNLPPELTQRQAGAFVSLHKNGELRGCIGTIYPTAPSLAQEILQNAVSAAAEDPRFAPVCPEELEELEIKVDVMGRPQPVESEEQLDARRYGVIVSSGGRRGLLLPDLEGVETPAQQVAIARRKAGIAPGAPVQLERFEVIRHQ